VPFSITVILSQENEVAPEWAAPNSTLTTLTDDGVMSFVACEEFMVERCQSSTSTTCVVSKQGCDSNLICPSVKTFLKWAGMSLAARLPCKKSEAGFDSHTVHHFSLERGLIMIECEQCNKKFKVAQRLVEKGRRFCSLSCSNKVARGNSLLQPDEKLTGQRKYIKICFRHHEKKCVICDESNIVTVHHFDGNHDNDSPENLIPVCPTHHSYVHSKFKNLVQPKIEEYRNNFILKKKQ